MLRIQAIGETSIPPAILLDPVSLEHDEMVGLLFVLAR